ncbi:MAG: Nramp family divalent metal transporter [Candidatus Riflebacteria bacterium]|nr:Nramp family divalent metal transporter [Candidatus Riflebacteria bacterium]
MDKTQIKLNNVSSDSTTRKNALEILGNRKKASRLSDLVPFLGPAFIASVAYIDPGNFATNIEGGAKFGYMLLWVIFLSNLMAMLFQTLSAKLGIATGLNLAEHCREQFPRPIVIGMWLLMEVAAMSTDLAEFLGAALGFNLLFGISLFWGAILTTIATLFILGLERYGFRPLEAFISAMVGTIALCYLIETLIGHPEWGKVFFHSLVPSFAGTESLFIASGILGATVMPHAIFLHSALTQNRIAVKDKEQLRRLFHFEIADILIAMGIAGLVNAAMLIMAAATFNKTGASDVSTIEVAYHTLEPLLGRTAKWFFGFSLLVSGLASSTVGTSAGQIIMQGFIRRNIPLWVRRLITISPSIIVIGLGFDPTRTLVASQVILSFGLPFALIPLVLFTNRSDLMGDLVNRKFTTILAVFSTAIVILLNLFLVYKTFVPS